MSLRRTCPILLYLVLASSAALAQTSTPRLLREPNVRNEVLAFRYAGDLWVTKLGSSEPARRLTSHPGMESAPKISPDGKLVAFNGSYDGTNEVYVIPIEGGEPKRLTFDGGSATVLTWTPDGQIAYGSRYGNFTSRQLKLYLVSPDGGLPRATKVAEVTHASFFPDGKTMAYMRSFPGNWRRYRGGIHGRISLYNLATNSYRELPHGGEQNYFPVAVGNSVYYVSDKQARSLNLWRHDLATGKETQLTRFTDADIRSASTDGKTIVWDRDGFIEAFDIATGKVIRQTPVIHVDSTATRPSIKSLAAYMESISMSPDGRRLVVGARGELLTVPLAKGDIVNLTRTSGVREMMPAWSPDGKSIAFIGDKTGEYEIYVRPAQGGEPTQLTTDHGSRRYTGLGWSPDGRHLELRTLSNEILLLDVTSKQLKLVVRQSTSMPSDWSPDGRWLAFVDEGANQMGSLYLHDVSSGKTQRVTEGYFSDNSVAFDKSGKYLYVRSSRAFTPSMGRFEYNFSVTNTENLYVVPLTADLPNPLRELLEGESKPETRAHVTVDLAGLDKRFVRLPVPSGNPRQLIGIQDGLLYVASSPGSNDQALWKFDLADREAKRIFSGEITAYSVSNDGSKAAILSGETIKTVDLKPGASAGQVDLTGLVAEIDPRQEWKQIFHDAWRWQRDEFYDPQMVGVDWPAIRRQYEQYLPSVSHRSDLNTLLSMMVNELGTSHAYVDGGDMGPAPQSVNLGYLGVDYVAEGDHVKLARVLHGSAHDETTRGPLGEPGFVVEAGSYLLEIDGTPVSSKVHPHALLRGKAKRFVTLTVNALPTLIGARKVRVRTLASENDLRYYEWTEATRRYVAAASGGRIGYMHIPSVLHNGAAEFLKGFYSQTDKEALIVDERWNVGGYFIQQLIVEMLNRKPILGTQYRNQPDGSSIRAIVGPKVMLINEYAGSGGDSFPWTFRAGGAGKLVGRRTMGALVGIANQLDTVDGGYVTAPDMGVYDPATGLLIAENYGVPPDIEVDMRPDLVAQGKDPQLDAAIQELLRQLEKWPKRQPRKEIPRVPPGGRTGGG